MEDARLAWLANVLRQDVLEMLATAGSGHSAGALGLADLFAVLYFAVLRHDPRQPDWPDRDRLVLSAGHVCPILYAALAEAGYFPRRQLLTLRQIGSPLQGHPHVGELPGVEVSSGSLGQGLSQAIGMAIAARQDQRPCRIYAVMGDGEHGEGQVWEALLLAAREQLGHLTVVVDRNGIQIDGPTETVLPLDSVAAKYAAFGWEVVTIPGHDIPALRTVLATERPVTAPPLVLILETVPGCGVPFMEGDHRWHGKPPTVEQSEQAIMTLAAQLPRVPTHG